MTAYADLDTAIHALRVGAALVRRAPSPDTTDGWTLYHQSFREYVRSAPGLAGTVEEMQERLSEAADFWADDVRLSRYTVEKYEEDLHEDT